MSKEKAKQHGCEVLATIKGYNTVGVKPEYVMEAPIPGVKALLKKMNLTIDDIDLVEVNEAFAAQVLSCLKFLNFSGGERNKMNVHGGAIALGHPIGCSGARIMTTLLHEMERRKSNYGLVTACIGVGQGIATIVQRI
jgi:acetyl-CoA acyltransferase